MADFSYNAKYEGKVMAPGLSGHISEAIENALDSGKLCGRKYSHPCFDSAYRIEHGSDLVFMGIKKIPGKLAGTEEARIEFAGRESGIMSAKSRLLEIIEDLELD